MRVLLIEDDLDVAISISDFLEYKNITVDFAYDVQQAKHVLNDATFDLIIMDINLPDGNGVELCRDLIEKHNVKQPILFLSARATEKDRLAAFGAGAIDFVPKPFSMLELMARIQNIKKHFNSVERYQEVIGKLSICLRTATASYDNNSVQLHKTGFKILHSLVMSYPNAISTDRLSDIIWENEPPKSNPLRSHISRINSAFDSLLDRKLIKSIRGIGYKLDVAD